MRHGHGHVKFPGDMFYRAIERVKPPLCKRFIFMVGHRAEPRWDVFIRQVDGLILWKPFEMYELLSAMRSVLKKSGQPEEGRFLSVTLESYGSAPKKSVPLPQGRFGSEPGQQ